MTTSNSASVVLLHGAFLDGSCWNPVIDCLQAQHCNALAVQVPLSSLADAVAATRRTLARVAGPVILVGHSWSGVVITEVGLQPNVTGLVYVAAGVPNVGESFNDLLQLSAEPTPGVAGIQPDAEGFLWYDSEQFHAGLAADLEPDEARRLAAVQQPVAGRAFAAAVSQVAWLSKPAWYAISAGDAILAPKLQRLMAERSRATTVSLAGASHFSMLSQPHAIADLILDAIAGTGGR